MSFAPRLLPTLLLAVPLLGCATALPPPPDPTSPTTSAAPLEIAGDAPSPPQAHTKQIAADDCSAATAPLPAPFLGPAPPGLAAWYRFEETDGPVLDSSGHGHHGTATSSGLVRGAPGRVGRGLSFSGGHVRVPASPGLDFTTAATIELWVRITPELDKPLTVGSTVSRGTGDSDDNVTMQACCGGIQLIFSRASTGTTNVGSDCGVLPVCAWTHVAYVNDGRTLALYINGALTNTYKGGFLGPLRSDLFIGRREQGIFPFAGTMDEILWWREARSQPQICGDAGGRWSDGRCLLRP
ncbi:LamG domain-containing protein [Polyangium jinanense]|uniref:LamG domain-containing protein n=1 Tax=Polyangium jinanense TaxID=2829994 RepID=A0A9X3XCG5_9BACT|nr:LamG domain-containing protein [Polyangium jinanense]MDC3960519.1 LamG domain-containing protein [Polyangium jinanense]MDC3985381.1 LamG domain-containing protein [Polyangium jinanense]